MSPAGRSTAPTLRLEKALLREGHEWLAGMDEVGRGALAGPVTVGVVLVRAETRQAPSGVRDSKLLTPTAREALVPRLRRWAPAYAVGHAEPEEIDDYGIMAALRLAGRRAMAQLPVMPGLILLDGNHNWFSVPASRARQVAEFEGQGALLDLDQVAVAVPSGGHPPHVPLPSEPAVVTRIKADLRCAAVAAASVLAKVSRDSIMVARAGEFPQYGWAENKGYSAPEHADALRLLGPCAQHRRSWNLPRSEQDGDGRGDLGGTQAEAEAFELVPAGSMMECDDGPIPARIEAPERARDRKYALR